MIRLGWYGKKSAQTVRDGSQEGRDAVSVHDSPSPKWHGQSPRRRKPEAETVL